MLTVEEIRLILEIIQKQEGFGYSKDPKIGALQAKLSIMLQAKAEAGT